MVVYCLTNKINGKKYVGQTVKSLEWRIKRHGVCARYYAGKDRGCRALNNAIHKYGLDSFSAEIMESCNSIEQLNKQETYWIATLNTLSPNGYNLKSGGNRSLYSEDSRKKMSLSQKGKPSPFKGKKITTNEQWEHIKRICALNKSSESIEKARKTRNKNMELGLVKPGNFKPKTQKQIESVILAKAKTVIIVNPFGEVIEITNLSKFARENSLHKSGLSQLAMGKAKTHKGYMSLEYFRQLKGEG